MPRRISFCPAPGTRKWGRPPTHGKVKLKNEADPKPEMVSQDHVQKISRRYLDDRVYASDEARRDAIRRAEEVQSGLDPEFPSFMKPMTQSHVTKGFWLSLPSLFCKRHLPEEDVYITLIDENLDSFKTLFLANKNGFSAGWRGFSIAHGLVDGDALVFHLVNRTTFKVYIIRASGLSASKGKHIGRYIRRPEIKGETAKPRQARKPVKPTKQPRQARKPVKSVGQPRQVRQPVKSVRQPRQVRRPVKCSTSAESEQSAESEESLLRADSEQPPSMDGNQDMDQDIHLDMGPKCASAAGTSTQEPTPEQEKEPSALPVGALPVGNCFQCFRLKEEMRRIASKAESAIRENEELRFLKSCKVCMENDVSMLLLPCKHLCLCKECDPKLHICPICNTAKVSSVEVFTS